MVVCVIESWLMGVISRDDKSKFARTNLCCSNKLIIEIYIAFIRRQILNLIRYEWGFFYMICIIFRIKRMLMFRAGTPT